MRSEAMLHRGEACRGCLLLLLRLRLGPRRCSRRRILQGLHWLSARGRSGGDDGDPEEAPPYGSATAIMSAA